jgi:hypothetical protein
LPSLSEREKADIVLKGVRDPLLTGSDEGGTPVDSPFILGNNPVKELVEPLIVRKENMGPQIPCKSVAMETG